jgi:hypothetical protein
VKLRFYAKDEEGNQHKVYVPNFPKVQGAFPQYVGRLFIPGTAETGAQHPATAEPFECDSEDANGQALLNKFRRGKRCLWPADKATAEACGVDFVAVEVKDGVAVVKQTSAARARKDEP